MSRQKVRYGVHLQLFVSHEQRFNALSINSKPIRSTMTMLAPGSSFLQAHLAERLPDEALAKLRRINDRPGDNYAILRRSLDRQQELQTEKQQAEARIRQLTRPQHGGVTYGEDHPSVIEAKRELDRITADIARLTPIVDAQSSLWNVSGGLARDVDNFVRNALQHSALVACAVAEPKLARGETVTDAVERVRRRGRELSADLHRVRSAPIPSAVAKQKMRALIEALAERGAPNISGLIEHGAEVEFPSQLVRARVYNTEAAVAFHEAPDVLALIAWLHYDALVAKLDLEIAEESDDSSALSDEDRRTREAELLADILSNERDECSLIWQALDAGLTIEFRPDTSPLALLGLSTGPAALEPEMRPSSPERASYLVRHSTRPAAVTPPSTRSRITRGGGFDIPPAQGT